MGTLRTRWPALRASAMAIGLLFAIGIVLRAYLMLRWRPGFLGYSDSTVYLNSVPNGPFYSPFWPGGYAMFLTGVHRVSHELSLAVLLQHAFGVTSAALLYGAARRLGASMWIAAVPAAVLLLGGAQILFEHAILSEPLWSFLIAGAVYLSARAVSTAGRGRLAAAAAAGLVLGLSMVVRLNSLFVVAPLAVALLGLTPGPWRVRAAALAAAAAPCLVVVAGFQVAHHDSTGRWGFTTNGALNLYGRVAPWADCTKFDPPAGTRWLCQRTPPRFRYGHQGYVFLADSPPVKRYHLAGGLRPIPPEGARALTRFSRAAILGEPLTYLQAVGSELARIVDPDAVPGAEGQRRAYGASPALYVYLFEDEARTAPVIDILRRDWPGTALVRHDVGFFETLERATRPPPLLMIVVILLALSAPLAARAEHRRAAWVFTLVALAILVLPVVFTLYDWRHVVPGLPYLAAAAAIGADGLVARVASRRRPASGGPT